MLYNPLTSEVYKTTFNIYRPDARTDDPVGYLDDTRLLYVDGDVDEYSTVLHFPHYEGYLYQALSLPATRVHDINKNRATVWSHKMVFLVYAIIQDPTGTYKDLLL